MINVPLCSSYVKGTGGIKYTRRKTNYKKKEDDNNRQKRSQICMNLAKHCGCMCYPQLRKTVSNFDCLNLFDRVRFAD